MLPPEPDKLSVPGWQLDDIEAHPATTLRLCWRRQSHAPLDVRVNILKVTAWQRKRRCAKKAGNYAASVGGNCVACVGHGTNNHEPRL